MKTIPVYSDLVSCIYDEPEAVGNLGHGTHYSVFRSVEWRDVVRTPIAQSQIHDFAVIWDEDHDTRVIEAVEAIYMAGLLSPVQFIGEHKGMLTVIVAAKFFWHGETEIEAYTDQLSSISRSLPSGDSWDTVVGMFDRQPGSPHQNAFHKLIVAEEHRVTTYLRHIDSLWALGTKQWIPVARQRAASVTESL